MPAPGLKGRPQRSQVRKHLVATPPNTPSGLETKFFGGALDPGLRPGLSETGPSGLNRKRRQSKNETLAPMERLVSWVTTWAEAQGTVGVFGGGVLD